MRAIGSTFVAISALVLMSIPAVAGEEVTVIPDSAFCDRLSGGDSGACEETLESFAAAGLVPKSYAARLVVAPGDGNATVVAAPTPVVGAIVHEGGGQVNTAPFQLAGGDYFATIDTGACTDFLFAALIPTHGYPQGLVDNDGDGASSCYGVEPGRYYWDVTGGCEHWTVTLVPYAG